MNLNTVIRVVASIVVIGAIIFFVIPGMFWTAARIIFELFILVIWGIVGYILLKVLESIWKSDKK